MVIWRQPIGRAASLVRYNLGPALLVPPRLHGSQEYRGGARRRCIASGIGSEDFDEVVAEVAVNHSRAAGTKYHILEAAVHKDVVADVCLSVEVVGGLRPRQLHLKVAKTVGEDTR